jgi:hypothetical protein
MNIENRQMALRQQINSFCAKYKYNADDHDIRAVLGRALREMSLSNFMDARTKDDGHYVRVTVKFLGELIVHDGWFTPEQLKDLADIGSEIKFES